VFTTDRRPLLQAILEGLQTGLKVYFQPPEDMTMEYPCIRYQRDTGSSRFANNVPYTYQRQYEVTLISRTPDSTLHEKLAALPRTIHDRFFVADNLNHDVFSIYF
jgi:hypothetical protein